MVRGISQVVLEVEDQDRALAVLGHDLPRIYAELRARRVEFPEPPVRQPFGCWSMFADSECNRFALTAREEKVTSAGERIAARGTQTQRGSAEEAAPS